MKSIHVRNLEKYNPGYTDRSLIWCKIYFTMLNSNYEFELIDDVDKWRLIALIMLEIQMQKPIPYDEKWLQKKITTHKRPIALTIKVLHNFLDFVTLDDKNLYPRVDKSRVDKNRDRTFTPPTIKEIQEYCDSTTYKIDPDKFIDFYTSKGWMVGKNKMKDWKAAVRNWFRSQSKPFVKKGTPIKTDIKEPKKLIRPDYSAEGQKKVKDLIDSTFKRNK